MIQNYGFTGANTNISAAGNFFQYLEAPSAARGIDDRVTVFVDGANLGTRRPGDWLQLPRQAQRWQIQPVDPACVGVVAIGVGKLGTARVAGTVEVVDGGVKSSLAGLEFIAAIGASIVASQNAFVTLANFATGNRIAVRRIRVTSGAATRVQIRATSPGASTPGTPLSSVLAQNKNLGTAVAGLGLFQWTEATENPVQVSPLPVPLAGFQLPANGLAEIPLDPPLIMGVNEGLLVSSLTQANSIWVGYEGTIVS